MTLIAERPVDLARPSPDGPATPRTLAEWAAGRWVILVTAVGLTVVATWPIWGDVLHRARHDEEASHLLLVPIVAGWLAWSRRGRLTRCRDGVGRWAGPTIASAGGLLWLYGVHFPSTGWTGTFPLSFVAPYLGAILMTIGTLVAGTGSDVLRRFLPALGVLVFLIPIPEHHRMRLAGPMQTAAAGVTQNLCEVLGIDVIRTGNVLSINGMDVAVAEACNGMRMIFAFFLAAYVLAFAWPYRPAVRAMLLALAPLFALGGNIARLLPTVWVYGHASADVATAFHDAAGWVMLIVAFLLLSGLLNVLEWAGVPLASPTPAPDPRGRR